MAVSQCREYREGRLGRNRTYICRLCGEKFQVFTKAPLRLRRRICGAHPELREEQDDKATTS
ncbi:hypothetical protein LCGC14_0420210 [marine sediment metagenome]|uniref:Uncharacterized protein n=1 Tax=marine sediment metagenome TaxID=412755 RepID=A0A0F9T8X5_9ZZZZ